jgi:uncharacterized protein YjdB
MNRIPCLVALALVACGPTVKSVSVEPQRAVLDAKNATATFTATAKDDAGRPIADPKVKPTWTSSAPLVASVDAAGKVTALKSGEAVITAAFGEVKGNAKATVTIPASATVSPASVELAGAGKTATLTVKVADDSGKEYTAPRVTWSSSDPRVATVSDKGVVTAVSGGAVTISASVGSARGETRAVVRLPQFARLQVKPARVALARAGATGKLVAAALDRRGKQVAGVPVSWRSANEKIVRVEADGMVTAVKKGKTRVTASAGGKSASAEVTVKK